MTGVDIERETLGTDTVRVRLRRGGEPLSRGEVIEGWRDDEAFRDRFLASLESEHDAVFWETPALGHTTRDRPYEHVLVRAPSLARVRPEPDAFREHFGEDPGDGVVTFPNLGGDAELVVPCPLGDPSAYPHLAAFVRAAPRAQVHALWSATARTLDARLRRTPDRPTWVSTSGLGVHWIHLRLDSRPKYYQHAPYRRWE